MAHTRILNNGTLAVHLVGEPVERLEICLLEAGGTKCVAHSRGLVGMDDGRSLLIPPGRLLAGGDREASLAGGTDGWEYRLDLRLHPTLPLLAGEVSLKAHKATAGWAHVALEAPAGSQQWIYPWVNADRYYTPCCITTDIGVDSYKHIWASLAGMPAILSRQDGIMCCLGFPLGYCYRHGGLACDPEATRPILAAGAGLPNGGSPTGSPIVHAAGESWSFPWQFLATSGSYPELARLWTTANDFRFDTAFPRSPAEALAVIEEGRWMEICHGVQRYYPRGSLSRADACGYRHGSDDHRISLYRQSYNAYADYLFYLRTGKAGWRERALDQIDFLLAAQTDGGWFYEDWNLLKDQFTYQGITEFGARPDHIAMVCDYLVKLERLVAAEEGQPHPAWLAATERCLSWILAQESPDGSYPMTVLRAPARVEQERETVRAGFISGRHLNLNGHTDPVELAAPMGRLLVALAHLEPVFPDLPLGEARKRHENWVLRNCVAGQKWWGSHKDTGLVVDYGGLQSFIQYCLDMFGRCGERRYLDLARETTYFNFFCHCPKDLEWLTHTSKWGIMEQGNYMQYDIDAMDNRIYSAWHDLARLTGDGFLADLARQALRTAMFTLCTDKDHPWYGSWGQYLVDPAGTAVTMDTSPVNGDATKYAGSIVCTMIEELVHLQGNAPEERR